MADPRDRRPRFNIGDAVDRIDAHPQTYFVGDAFRLPTRGVVVAVDNNGEEAWCRVRFCGGDERYLQTQRLAAAPAFTSDWAVDSLAAEHALIADAAMARLHERDRLIPDPRTTARLADRMADLAAWAGLPAPALARILAPHIDAEVGNILNTRVMEIFPRRTAAGVITDPEQAWHHLVQAFQHHNGDAPSPSANVLNRLTRIQQDMVEVLAAWYGITDLAYAQRCFLPRVAGSCGIVTAAAEIQLQQRGDLMPAPRAAADLADRMAVLAAWAGVDEPALAGMLDPYIDHETDCIHTARLAERFPITTPIGDITDPTQAQHHLVRLLALRDASQRLQSEYRSHPLKALQETRHLLLNVMAIWYGEPKPTQLAKRLAPLVDKERAALHTGRTSKPGESASAPSVSPGAAKSSADLDIPQNSGATSGLASRRLLTRHSANHPPPHGPDLPPGKSR